MISERYIKQYCCEDISLIENYKQAVEDTTKTWDLHHRGEILPCGRYSIEDLKKFGLYYNRPTDELIFLTKSEHRRLHMQGKQFSVEHCKNLSESKRGKHHSAKTREKISKGLRGNTNMLGKHHSDEAREKMSKANRGKHRSEKTRKKISEARKRYLAKKKAVTVEPAATQPESAKPLVD